jgi:8-oxo-dGTP pyrophosphatase MutT (NUDIX family)
MKEQSTSAATVILLRDVAAGGFEVFLTRRPDEMPACGGTYGFPGSAVSKEDCSAGMLARCCGLAPAAARDILGAHFTPQEALGCWVAGIRTLLEEVGILLAVNGAGKPWIPGRVENRPIFQRTSLLKNTLGFQSLLQSEGLFCDTSKLFYFSHWDTSLQPSVRFDSRFFLAALPRDQTPLGYLPKVVHGLWLTPDQALKRFAKDELPMMFPTFASLRTLADFESLERQASHFGGGRILRL